MTGSYSLGHRRTAFVWGALGVLLIQGCAAKQPQVTNVYHYYGDSTERTSAPQTTESEKKEPSADPMRIALARMFKNFDRTQLEFQEACPRSVTVDENGSEWCMTSDASGFSVKRNGFKPFVSSLSFRATLEQTRKVRSILEELADPTYDQELDAQRWELAEANLFVTSSDGIVHVALWRKDSETPGEAAVDPHAVLTMLEVLLDETGDNFSAECDGEPKQWPGKGEFAGWSFYACSYNMTETDLGHVTLFMNVGPDGITHSAGLMFLMEHFARFQAAAQEMTGRGADEREEGTRLWHLPRGTLKLMSAPRTGWGLVQLERSGVLL